MQQFCVKIPHVGRMARWVIALLVATGISLFNGLAIPINAQDTIPTVPHDQIDTLVEYDSLTGGYFIHFHREGVDVRPPVYMTHEEFMRWKEQQQSHLYWMDNRDSEVELEGGKVRLSTLQKGKGPELPGLDSSVFNIFGGDFVSIRPTGEVSLTVGYKHTKTDNPLLPERFRRIGYPDFNTDMRFSVVGSIGDLMKINFNFDSKAQLNFNNQIRLRYEGKEHHIIKEIEAGNVSFPLKNSLITGAQQLMGIKTKLQFGRLTVTAVASQKQSQTQTITFQGGAQTKTVEIKADEYEENKHFLLSHYFKDNYEQALSELPKIKSNVRITRIEVWVTNTQGRPENAREIVALMDLGEPKPYRTAFKKTNAGVLPSNDANTLYATLNGNPNARSANTVVQELQTLGLEYIKDFEKVYARKLSQNEFTLYPELGFISLNISLQPNEVLAVAYEYTYNGEVYRVGEFSDEVPIGENNDQVLFLKMIKSSGVFVDLPIWELMMKNIYPLRAWQISPEDFYLDVYYIDPGGGYKRYIPEGSIQGVPLIRVLKVDQVNKQGQRRPDGVFDFLPGITIDPQRGRVIFPVLEPFGKTIKDALASEPHLWGKYVYQELYTTTKVQARQKANKNRYVIRVRYKSAAGSTIDLGRMNIPEGSVRVTVGGRTLEEGRDYTVDYMLGKVRIINDAILQSGQPVNVTFESQDFILATRKFFIGTRFDYWINKNLSLGATWLRLTEQTYTYKVDMNTIPVTNEIVGADLTYSSPSMWLTQLVNKLPGIESKQQSQVRARLEVAHFMPKENKAVRLENDKNATIYLDDFEGVRHYYDIRLPVTAWKLAATPQRMVDYYGQPILTEGDSVNSLAINYNRAHLSWFAIDPVFYDKTGRTPDYIKNNPDLISNHFVREVLEQEVFPQKASELGTPLRITTLNLAYYPNEPGPYNYITELTPDGYLTNPEKRWAGITQSLYVTDFEQAGIEYIELWLMDPFVYDPFAKGGELYIHLGNVSEDVLSDSRLAYENGLPGPEDDPAIADTTIWGLVPKFPPITRTFDNDPAKRTAQDVGLDGIPDEAETFFRTDYLGNIQAILSPEAYQRFAEDPSRDNFKHYLDPELIAQELPILDLYKYYSNPEGNSPVGGEGEQVFSATNYPDNEDLNEDNTLNQAEAYYQYVVRITPADLQPGNGYVTDMVTAEVTLPNGNTEQVRWYQIRIPIRKYQHKTGGISDFRSIRFIRMILHGWDTTAVLRFARVALVGSTWRIYEYDLKQPGEVIINDDVQETDFDVSVVNIEENSEREPIPYVLPPGVQREVLPSSISGVAVQQNEQSLVLKVCNLEDGDSRAVYKEAGVDLRQFERLRMFIHAEEVPGNPLQDGEMHAFLRLGYDFTENYYEYIVPLKLTPYGTEDPELVWPAENRINILLDSLVIIKRMRDEQDYPVNKPFDYVLPNGHIIRIVGKPDLGRVQTMMLGISNPADGTGSRCVEVWFNELRVAGYKNYGGSAAQASVDIALADVANISIAGKMHTPGFGALNQTITERRQDYFQGVDFAIGTDLSKFLFKSIKMPVYLAYSNQISTPRYHPFETDIVLREYMTRLPQTLRDSLKNTVQTARDIRSITFTNIRKIRTGKSGKPMPWDLSNLSFSGTYKEERYRDPFIQQRFRRDYRIGAQYSYSPTAKPWEPFKLKIRANKRHLRWLREFNFSFLPQSIKVGYDWDRKFMMEQLRSLTAGEVPIPPYYEKEFLWHRTHSITYNPFRSLRMNFTARATSLIPEPEGPIDTREERQIVQQNMSKFGVPQLYTHDFNANYKAPFDKFPIINWLYGDVNYKANYKWEWAPPASQSFGNTISNNRETRFTIGARPRKMWRNLHNTYWWVKEQVNPSMKYKRDLQKWKVRLEKWKARKAMGKEPGPKPKKPKPPRAPAKPKTTAGKIIKGLIEGWNNISLTYTIREGTTLPGFMLQPRWLGMDSTFSGPGWDFLFGYQPDTSWLPQLAQKGWLSTDTFFNMPFQQSREDRITGRISTNFFKVLNISIDANRTFTRNYSEIFKDTIGDGTGFAHLTPLTTGSFSISWNMWSSTFDKPSKGGRPSETFQRFEQYRQIVSQLLGRNNPYSAGEIDTVLGFYDGYGPNSPQVLIPAFIAAYSGIPIEELGPRNYFPQIPKPNWSIRLSGLQRIGNLKNIFSSISINHSYKSSLKISNFKSSFFYKADNGYDTARNPISGDFYPMYEITTVTIDENMSPLLGIQVNLRSGYNFNFSINRTRSVQLSIMNYQVNENQTWRGTLTIGGQFKNVRIPFKIGGIKPKLKKPIRMSITGGYGYSEQTVHRLSQNLSEIVNGAISYQFKIAFTYEPMTNLKTQLFFDYNKSIPLVSRGYPTRIYFFGITAIYSLTGL